MHQHRVARMMSLATITSLTAATLMGSRADAHIARPHALRAHAVSPVPAITVRLFASGTTSGVTKPDSIVVTKQHVYIAYQNNAPPTGSLVQSTIVEYTRAGVEVQRFSVTGRCDGMRWNPYTQKLWATVNEDSYPGLYVIRPQNRDLRRYAFTWPTTHGGGFDDIAFSGGKAFVSASNPTLNAAGVNTGPALDEVTLLASGLAKVMPILSGDALVKDLVTNTLVHINAVDPDSLQVAPNGDVALVDQGGTELILIHHAGTSTQSASRIVTGTQLDDIDVTRSTNGALYIVDSAKNATYVATAPSWPLGQIWTEAPNDSGVASFVGTFDLTTGTVVPELVGFGSPTGLIWVDASAPDEGPF